MIYKTIDALKKNKLHEAVLRISQFNLKDLTLLLECMLIADYTKVINKKAKVFDPVEYSFELPDAYDISFKLYKEKDNWRMSLFFNYDELLNLDFGEDDILIVSEDYAEMTLELKDTKWELYSSSTKKNIYNIIKNV